ncbi:MAG TPA: hydrogenase maturation protease [Pirellulales bacterium]|nr:hydrogenase maturation protease [Pirellulales bacterium]
MSVTTLIVGLGSPHGDDQIGWRVAERLALERESACGASGLRGPLAPQADCTITIRTASSPADLLDWLEGVERLIVCDACQAVGSPGTVHCWRWPEAPLGRLRSSGSHDLSLAEVLTLAEELRSLPGEVIIWAVESRTCQCGAAMSAEAATAVAQTSEEIGRSLPGPSQDRTTAYGYS